MGETTNIEWAEATWNPWMGCTKVSAGCKNCYMYRDMKRYGREPSVVERASDRTFGAPERWKEPKRIFVCSWSDFFHEDAIRWQEEAWDIMRRCPQHTFMLLTKRPAAMVDWATSHLWLPNVWAGVTVESQDYVWRLDMLAMVPAPVLFASCEPLLGPVDLSRYLLPKWWQCPSCWDIRPDTEPMKCPPYDGIRQGKGMLDGVLCGGESGPRARPMHPAWPRGLRDLCIRARVPFMFKQWGEWAPKAPYYEKDEEVREWALDWNPSIISGEGRVLDPSVDGQPPPDAWLMKRIGKRLAGRILDGREWLELPQPKTRHRASLPAEGCKPVIDEIEVSAVKPTIICLCGSTRFYRAFDDWNYRFTLAGYIVLSIGCNTKSDRGLGITEEQKAQLDALHKRKIDLADEVFVLDVGGYIGESTRSEIEYAKAHGKKLWYVSEVTPPYQEPTDPVQKAIADARVLLSRIRGWNSELWTEERTARRAKKHELIDTMALSAEQALSAVSGERMQQNAAFCRKERDD